MAEEKSKQSEYRVLARKYRPQNFDELIGQDALVRTLKNAIESGRIAHAFMLTGVRGVGKTTTARIIAKALNYTGADGNAEATTGDTADCKLCQAIAEDRHPDVMEMDAASRTGVDDIREILDGVRYAPSEARYKVYIIDEVHMLSKQAFNALLKTLEEPPPHVKFIFATTEIRKVPITVLSRCQRFDLRRVDAEVLRGHFENICGQENVKADDDALKLIARAADGSVRDGLSILDQAIALGGDAVSAQQVQDMLGLAEGAKILDLLDHALGGRVQEALNVLDDLYKAGGDPVIVMQDLLERVHMLTRLKAVPGDESMVGMVAPDALERMQELSGQLGMPALGKAWQLLLKGLAEVQQSPNPQSAAEMVVMRLMYASELPDPKDLIKMIKDGDQGGVQGSSQMQPNVGPSVSGSGTGSSAPSPTSGSVSSAPQTVQSPRGHGGGPQASAAQPAQLSVVQSSPVRMIKSLEDVVAVLEDAQEIILASEVFHNVELVKLKEGMIEIGVRENAQAVKLKMLQKVLSDASGQRWVVTFVPPRGVETLAEKAAAKKAAEYEEVLNMPKVQDVIRLFPEAQLVEIISEEEK
jgi:DNA polymerase-3 subunit gamma/tau